ncbi:MAG: mechanosensitive ion channel domain-containing protein [Tunicatimonas sp.]
MKIRLRCLLVVLLAAEAIFAGAALAQTDTTVVPRDSVATTVPGSIRINAQTLVIQVDSAAIPLAPRPTVVDSVAQKVVDITKPPTVQNISIYKIVWSIVIFGLGYFIIRFLTRLVELAGERSTNYRIMIKGFVPVVRIIGWIVVIFIIIAGVLQPRIEAVLALTASVGVAVGFASQDILKNIFGGVVILLDAPFKVGDKIEIGSHYGEVVEIGLRSTRIVTPDDSLVSIPNGELMNQSVSNSNAGELNCQVVAEIYLPLDIDTERVRNIAQEAAQTSRYIFLNKPITVLFFNEVKERRPYYKMRLKAYVMDIRYEFIFKSELTEIVIRELLHEQIITAADYA